MKAYLTGIVRTRWVDYKDHEFDPYVATNVETRSKTNVCNSSQIEPGWYATAPKIAKHDFGKNIHLTFYTGTPGCHTWSTSHQPQTRFCSARSASGSQRSTGRLSRGPARDTSLTTRTFQTATWAGQVLTDDSVKPKYSPWTPVAKARQ